jgi:protein phosphatase
MVTYHAISDPGCVRSENEDRLLIDSGEGLFVVADGMGGHRHGELAAEVALSTMKYYLDSSRHGHDVTWPFGYNFELSLDENRLVTSIRLANRQVWKRAEEAPEYAGMGTTIAASLISGSEAAVANVGDSRVYLVRSGRLQLLTIDDTWISSVLQKGALDREAILNHPMRNVLTQAAGSQHEIEVHTASVQLETGDLVVLSTDGLHEVVPEVDLHAILTSGGSVEEMASRLVQAAKTEGAPDNVSCVVAQFEG